VGRLEGNSYVEDLGGEGRRILRRILKKYDARLWTGLIYPKLGESEWLL
jgi:hypothetical protein